MIRGIVFDCFGVLYHGSLGHLFELTPEHFHEELRDISKSSDYGYMTHEAYVSRVSVMTGKSTDEIEAIMRADHVRNEALVDYVRSLRGMYKIGLLSNVGRGVMDHLFSPAEQAELFDAVVLSSDFHMVKPYPEIYHAMADVLGLTPEDCLMVDDLVENIDGARAIGMQGVVYTTTHNSTAVIDSMLGVDRIQ